MEHNEGARPHITQPTIAAISTPHGVGGIAVIRLSGSDAYAIAAHHCKVMPSTDNGMATVRHTTFHHDGTTIDDVVVTFFRTPHSYTGEDVVEIACHGSLYIQQTILNALLSSGAIIAEPGEFTQRAFLSGRLNLSQAEAVNDLIQSTNHASHALAISQMRGGYAQRLADLRDEFIHLTSLLELELDFSEEDLQFADRSELLALTQTISAECQRLCDSFRQGNAIKNGVAVAIAGEPNVGKSSLLNTLLSDDRAIVSDIPGTTRDTIEDTLTLDGILFRFIDTAGLRHSTDAIETAGIVRSHRAIKQCDILLYLVPSNATQEELTQQLQDLHLYNHPTPPHLIVVQTKSDLATPTPLDPTKLLKDLQTVATKPTSTPQGQTSTDGLLDYQFCIEQQSKEETNKQNSTEALHQQQVPTNEPHIISISSHQGTNISRLQQLLVETATQGLSAINAQSAILTNQRHHDAMQNILTILPTIQQALQTDLPADLIVIHLRDALYHIGSITGQVTPPEIIHSIFSKFCVGK